MSGSYNNNGGRGPRSPGEARHPGELSHVPHPAPGYDNPVTGTPSGRPRPSLDSGARRLSDGTDDTYDQPDYGGGGHGGGTNDDHGDSNAAIVQAGSVTGRSLTLVVAIMCFLACLTAGAVYMINRSASAWLQDIASEVTVQIEPKEQAAQTELLVNNVQAFLGRQPGIAQVRSLGKNASAKLLEPWLGKSDALAELPIPRLIALELNRTAPPHFDNLRAALARQFPGVTLDDHRHWQNQIRTVTRSFALGGFAILLLVGAATTAVIVSATRSAMISNREIVEVLHFVGATDRFIAHEFEKHFLTLGVRAGLLGAGLAMAVFFLMPMAVEMLGGGTVTMAEIKRLTGAGVLDGLGYLLLAGVVVIIAALCMLTSRFGVYRILHSQP